MGAGGPAPPPFYADKHNLLVYLDQQGAEHPVQSGADWQKRRAHILANMQQVMGELPPENRRVPQEVQILEEVPGPHFVRREITFAVERGDRVPAYLFLPADPKGPVPAMLCLHQTTPLGQGEPAGLGGSPNLHYAQELAERGYV